MTAEEFCKLKEQRDGGVSSDFWYDAMVEFAEHHILTFADSIKHGDEEHQTWLLNAANEYVKSIK